MHDFCSILLRGYLDRVSDEPRSRALALTVLLGLLMGLSCRSPLLQRDFNKNQTMVEIELDGMDLDVDFGSVDDINEPLALTNKISEYAVPSSHISASGLTPHKVYVRGLEDLTTSDIRTFSSEHYPSKSSPRVEWIDDTSANLVFEDEKSALLALHHLTLPSNDNVSLPLSQLRSAKALSTHPNSTLYVRVAAITDRKRARAYEASRFYMMRMLPFRSNHFLICLVFRVVRHVARAIYPIDKTHNSCLK